MPEVSVPDLDPDVVEQREVRARANGRSLQAELKLILERAAEPGPALPSRADYRALADQVRTARGDRPQADSAALLAEDRAR